jgi:hypothetical protein
VHGQDQHRDAGNACAELASMPLVPRILMSISTRSTGWRGLLQRFRRAAGLGHHLELRHGFQPRAQAVAHQGMVVYQQDLDRIRHYVV